MTEKRFSVERFMNPKYYYGLDGNITDGENVYRTKNMPKEDVNEVFLDEKQLGSNSLMDCLNALNDENEQLKKVLGSILLEVKRDISNKNQTGEIKVFINPNSFDLISEVLRKYGALKEWYE